MRLSSCLPAAGSPDFVPAGDSAFCAEDAVDFGDLGFAEYDPALGQQNVPLRAPDFHQGALDRGQQNVFPRAPDFHQGALDLGQQNVFPRAPDFHRGALGAGAL